MLKFKTSKENYSGNERVTAIILLLIQFRESSTLPDTGNRIKLKRQKAERKTAGGAVEKIAQIKSSHSVESTF